MNDIRPILFCADMVRAIIDGRKTQTRRVVRDAHGDFWDHGAWTPTYYHGGIVWHASGDPPYAHRMERRCPYGGPEDRLWVRETWTQAPRGGKMANGEDQVYYRADMSPDVWRGFWRPSIFMPRWASRLTLEIIDVRVERVQDISEADARAEGCRIPADDDTAFFSTRYRVLWDSLNSKRGYGWDRNVWVWSLTFRRLK